MTENEWLTCTDVDTLLDFLRDRATDRKFRLFLCACVRRLFPVLSKPRTQALDYCQQAVMAGEAYAEGRISSTEF